MCDHRIAEPLVRQPGQHRGLHHGHDLAGFGADHREAEDAIVAADQGFHEAARFIGRVRAEHRAHRHPRDPHGDPFALGLALGQADMGQWRIGEQAVRNDTIPRRAASAGEVVLDDPKVVDGDVREVRAAGTFADRPDIGGRRLQPLIHTDIAASIQFDASFLESDSGGVRDAPRRDQNVASLESPGRRKRCARLGGPCPRNGR